MQTIAHSDTAGICVCLQVVIEEIVEDFSKKMNGSSRGQETADSRWWCFLERLHHTKECGPTVDFSPQCCISGPHRASPRTDNGATIPQLTQDQGQSLSKSTVESTCIYLSHSTGLWWPGATTQDRGASHLPAVIHLYRSYKMFTLAHFVCNFTMSYTHIRQNLPETVFACLYDSQRYCPNNYRTTTCSKYHRWDFFSLSLFHLQLPFFLQKMKTSNAKVVTNSNRETAVAATLLCGTLYWFYSLMKYTSVGLVVYLLVYANMYFLILLKCDIFMLLLSFTLYCVSICTRLQHSFSQFKKDWTEDPQR